MAEEEWERTAREGLAALVDMKDSAIQMVRAADAATKGLIEVARLAADHGDVEVADLALQRAMDALALAQEAKA
jgi:hypothetical protein